ncbi:MAG TPA: HAD family hydrolase [Gammaproteobacteria bacterium]|nr:HAD family hydrolase [Gammaproteobacteria bacterium]
MNSTATTASTRGITFDLDDTLWEVEGVLRLADARLHAWLARNQPRAASRFPPTELRSMMAAIAVERPARAHDFSYLRRAALSRAARLAGEEEDLSDEAFRIFLRARNEVVLYDDVRPVLDRLRRRYPMASITNGNADVRLIGLESYFTAAISATDVGHAKPHPAPFRAACAALGRPPAEVVHVGDDPESDVAGAASAGLRTVWVNRKGRAWPGGPPPDLEIRSLSELETALAAL